MTKRFLVTGGAGFIGSAFVRHALAATDHHVLVVDKLTYAGNLDSLAPVKDHPRFQFVRADIADARGDDGSAGRLPAGRHSASGGGKPCRSLDRRAGRVRADQCRRHVRPAAAGARLLARAAARPKRSASAFTMSRPTRCSARSDATGCSARIRPIGRTRPTRRSKAASDHLVRAWHHTYGLPVAHHQLLEQLRALSFSGEAHPADDPQCARGQAAAGLRRGRECARLALCRRSRARAAV